MVDFFLISIILSLFFIVIGSWNFYQLRSKFKQLKFGEKLSYELADQLIKKIRISTALIGIGCMIGLVAVMLRPFLTY